MCVWVYRYVVYGIYLYIKKSSCSPYCFNTNNVTHTHPHKRDHITGGKGKVPEFCIETCSVLELNEQKFQAFNLDSSNIYK
uniref:Uncharacterized protein n=1 Tax=Octopus bimaculoides TaxID=37653 RepID=A0A0L8FSW9_OCTBM